MKFFAIFGSIFICCAIGKSEAHAASAQPIKPPQKQIQNFNSPTLTTLAEQHTTLWAVAELLVVFAGFQGLAFATLFVLDLSFARDLYFRSGLSPPCFT